MTSFTSSSEALGLLVYGDEKRRAHFRIVDSVLSSGNHRRFGLTEYLYCGKHCTWHEQKNEAYVTVSEWSKLVNYSEFVDVYSKPIVERAISEKSNAELVKEYAAEPEPERKKDEALVREDAPFATILRRWTWQHHRSCFRVCTNRHVGPAYFLVAL
jgi:hypothetical protein